MTLTIDDIVTHYILSSHPKNKAIVDIKEKQTGELKYIKIRHRLSKFYAVSLVDPVTFEVWAETQAKSATAKIKPIVLHLQQQPNTNATVDTPVEFRDTSRIGFEWTFTWEGEKYRWVRESRMSNILECKAIRKSGDICVAQYLPRMLKDEYFGIFSLLGYNMLRCNLTKSRELELIILMSLMTLLDKSNDGSWKRDFVSKGGETQDELIYNEARETKKEPTSTVLPAIAYEDPIPTKSMQKKYKKEQLNDQKLQLLLEKDVKRSQKQIQTDQKQFMTSLSADNSPAHTPKTSPLPTPSTSTSNIIRSPRLNHQKSMNALNSTSTPNQQQASREKTNQNGGGRLSRLFSSLSHVKQSSNNSTAEPSSNMSSPIIKSNKALPATTSQQYVTTSNQQLRRQQSHKQFEYNDSDYYDSHHLSLPTGYVAQRITNEFGNLSINNNNYDNPPSLRTIRWNPEPSSSYVQQPQYYVSRSNSQGRKKSHLVVEDGRRLSASEYSGYPYHYTNNNTNRYSASEYYMPSYQHSHPFDYYL